LRLCCSCSKRNLWELEESKTKTKQKVDRYDWLLLLLLLLSLGDLHSPVHAPRRAREKPIDSFDSTFLWFSSWGGRVFTPGRPTSETNSLVLIQRIEPDRSYTGKLALFVRLIWLQINLAQAKTKERQAILVGFQRNEPAGSQPCTEFGSGLRTLPKLMISDCVMCFFLHWLSSNRIVRCVLTDQQSRLCQRVS